MHRVLLKVTDVPWLTFKMSLAGNDVLHTILLLLSIIDNVPLCTGMQQSRTVSL